MESGAAWLANAQTRACPLCGSLQHHLLSTRMQYKLDLHTVICSNCSFVFTNPIPPRQTYEQFYTEAYAQYYGRIALQPTSELQNHSPIAIRVKLETIEQISRLKGKRLLEVGPGQGLFLWWARQ